jgi:Asp-tRNA(Asn)/Glu-tRNA(Gln) amidotransferase A subunit family amidase
VLSIDDVHHSEVGNPSLRDGVIVKVLKDAGAVPFVKTNVPQTLLAFECGNPVFGVTRNPYNGERTCGGSSGGEAALLASDASPIGIGSDVGGSLRIPAHFSGCFGLKPCLGRFPGSGVMPPNPGFDAIKSTLGPMGRSVDDLESITRVVVDASIALARTQHLIPLAYRKVTLPAKLKFGYYLTGEFLPISNVVALY